MNGFKKGQRVQQIFWGELETATVTHDQHTSIVWICTDAGKSRWTHAESLILLEETKQEDTQ